MYSDAGTRVVHIASGSGINIRKLHFEIDFTDLREHSMQYEQTRISCSP